MKKQVVVIHGGDTFRTYKDYLLYLRKKKLDFESLKSEKRGWKAGLNDALGRNFEVILPRMPNPINAKYSEWKIIFNKLLPFLKNRVVLVGHSLGGIFLAKYLAESKFPKKILATFLIAAPYDGKDRNANYTLGDFVLPKSLVQFQKQGGKIFICHSKDDPVVPFKDLQKYQNALPTANAATFEERGHFNQEKFSWLVRNIKKLYR